VPRLAVALGLMILTALSHAESLTADRLGVAYASADPASVRLAWYYAGRRGIPASNLVGLPIPDKAVLSRGDLAPLRMLLLQKLPSSVQSLLLIWPRAYAVECMSVTTAFAAGYRPGFCEPGCARTERNPLFDSQGWLPADTVGWLPAMLLPSKDEPLARAVIDAGVRSDGTRPSGTLYLVRTRDAARNVRAGGYADTEALLGRRVGIIERRVPAEDAPADAIGYFTGTDRVSELHRITFRPGAVADHLTSFGGVLEGGVQMSAVEWLRQGATGSYGTVSEPCNHLDKFPSPGVFFDHYLRGDSLLEAYWKSVAMPGQGLFIGEPLARPYREAADEPSVTQPRRSAVAQSGM
jgi:uncharacterized protein (TIGR03790 family)